MSWREAQATAAQIYHELRGKHSPGYLHMVLRALERLLRAEERHDQPPATTHDRPKKTKKQTDAPRGRPRPSQHRARLVLQTVIVCAVLVLLALCGLAWAFYGPLPHGNPCHARAERIPEGT